MTKKQIDRMYDDLDRQYQDMIKRKDYTRLAEIREQGGSIAELRKEINHAGKRTD